MMKTITAAMTMEPAMAMALAMVGPGGAAV